MKPLDIALCYESVLPSKGGAETYIGDLSRRLAKDGHTVHLYACRWDARALPTGMIFHELQVKPGWRFQRPWRFATACEQALRNSQHDVSIGFDKTWSQDVLYPQGGLHHNRLKFRNPIQRFFADVGKFLDPSGWSFRRLERRQYLGEVKPTVIVNSEMVRRHFQQFYGITNGVRVIRSAIDPQRFAATDRAAIRQEQRQQWKVLEDEPVGLMVAMNYRLKGLDPLIRAAAVIPKELRFKLTIVGHSNAKPYEQLAQSLGVTDRFLFLGFRADPKEAYFAADFLVHPTFYDPCSLVVLEALACGLPVITTQYNGASELIDVPQTGLVVQDPHNAAELGGAIQQMLNQDYRNRAAVSASQAAQTWTFEQHYQALLKVFEEVRSRKAASKLP
jgi:UDP-glucose:(heptosyl)LPS alpha-1,3-glucosyltransferase